MAKGDQHPLKMHYGGRLMISDELENTSKNTKIRSLLNTNT